MRGESAFPFVLALSAALGNPLLLLLFLVGGSLALAVLGLALGDLLEDLLGALQHASLEIVGGAKPAQDYLAVSASNPP